MIKIIKLQAISVICFIQLFASLVTAQTYKFKHLSVEEGICHHVVYTVNQDKNGYIWAGTGEGLCRYDGFVFSGKLNKDSISQAVCNKSFKDSKGNLWFGHNDGSITFYDGTHFKYVNVEDKNKNNVTDISEKKNGDMVFSTQSEGIIIIDKKLKITKIKVGFENLLISSIIVASNDDLLVGTQSGLFLAVPKGQGYALKAITGVPLTTNVQCIARKPGSNLYWIGTEDAGLFEIETGNSPKVKSLSAALNLPNTNVQSILLDKDLNLWVSTFGSGIIKLIYSNSLKSYTSYVKYDDSNGLDINFIKQVFQDREGNIWAATYGKGIAFLSNASFLFFHYDNEVTGKNIQAVCTDGTNFWLGGEKGLLKLDLQNNYKTVPYSKKDGLPNDNITALYADNSGVLWVGTEKSGLYKMERGGSFSRAFFSENSMDNSINHISSKNGILYLATKNGLFLLNTSDHSKKHFTTTDQLPHNDIVQVFNDSKNNTWLSTKSQTIFPFQNSTGLKVQSNIEFEFKGVTEDRSGNLWAATYGDGLLKYQKDSVVQLNSKNGLKSNYCYSIVTSKDGEIWVGHRLGLSRVDPQTMTVKSYGKELGITGDCNFNAVAINKSGVIVLGTTDGIVLYDYSKDRKDTIPPVPNILRVTLSDTTIDFTSDFIQPYGVYKLHIDYVGLHYRSPESVRYKYKLEGYDLDWSDFTSERSANYSRIEDGKYTFRLRAYNSDGIYKETSLKITIRPPFWKTWWFITLSIISLIAAIYFYILYRERKHRKFQEFLQKNLDERTREVMEQKEVIELKNKDITDSINYAQRIQASILPSIRKLQENFSGCFVFYQPRDIVSGDFYWFDKFEPNRFVIVCADSTGHGVPGAFMSMIGTTLIKDICNRKDISSPSVILELLDNDIKSTLNQDNGPVDDDKSSDGMDIIVCEINTETSYVRTSTAMRPIIMFRNGEEIYTRGSRTSVGGEMGKEDKNFKDEGFQLSKGDLIYLFSDGYPDQFGGQIGKKFKMVRLKNLLKEIHELPMDEQYVKVKNAFINWKGKYDQVDDVLFMGIKI
jgi:ligand-binding sensor domain-containing protein/serine phosphatase RsbU (regulator of sigma subunit)